MIALNPFKEEIRTVMDQLAPQRDRYIAKNKLYYDELIKFFKFNIPRNSKVLEIGCGTGYLLNAIEPSSGVGIDISEKMIEIGRQKYPNLKFLQMDGENLSLEEQFDFIIISDTICYFEDIQKVFHELHKVSSSETRIIMTYHNFLWQSVLKFAEKLQLKMPSKKTNWFNHYDTSNVLSLENFEVINFGQRILFPKYVPLISWFCNKYLSQLPVIKNFCLIGYTIAKPLTPPKAYSVSVAIPAKNEKGNIENAVLRTPKMGKHTEIIFVEGGSQDGTLDEIIRVQKKYSGEHDISYTVQDGVGKGDAVRKAYAMSKGDILMILDADLTVPPESLHKFYNAIASGKAEYVNGSRLVYPLGDESMRFINILGNKFFAVAFSWLLGQRYKDTLCGTKVLSKKNWERIVANRSYFGDFDPFGDFDIIFGAAKLNLKIVEVPIRYQGREYGETQIRRFAHGWLLIKMTIFAARKIKFY